MTNKKDEFNVGFNLDDLNKVELTIEGKEELERKLRNLINIERPNVQKELAEARAQGDLSENAEYDSARNKQAEIEEEIAKIEDTLTRVKIISTSQGNNKIHVGSKVTYLNQSNSEETTIMIVPEAEYDPLFKPIKVGTNTILAKSIMGSKINDEIVIKTETPYKIIIKKIF